jgi:WD40 repeat protein
VRNEVKVWDIDAEQLLISIPPETFGDITAIAWSPDGNSIAGGTSDSTITIWDAQTGELQQTYQATGSGVTSLDWNMDGSLLASTTFGPEDGTAQIWNRDDVQPVATFSARGAQAVMWNPLMDEFAVGLSNMVRILDPLSARDIFSIPVDGLQQAVAYSPFGGRLAFGGVPNLQDTVSLSAVGTTQTLSDGAVQILVPDPSPERLQAIAEACDAPLPVMQAAANAETQAEITTFEAAVEALPEGAIPPACAADLLAVAQAMQD